MINDSLSDSLILMKAWLGAGVRLLQLLAPSVTTPLCLALQRSAGGAPRTCWGCASWQRWGRKRQRKASPRARRATPRRRGLKPTLAPPPSTTWPGSGRRSASSELCRVRSCLVTSSPLSDTSPGYMVFYQHRKVKLSGSTFAKGWRVYVDLLFHLDVRRPWSSHHLQIRQYLIVLSII